MVPAPDGRGRRFLSSAPPFSRQALAEPWTLIFGAAMAYWLTDRALKHKEIGGSEKLLLALLAMHADDAGECFMSQEALCVESGLGERTVRDALNSLEDKAIIQRERRYRKAGGRGIDKCVLKLGSKPAKSAGLGSSYRQKLPLIPAKSAAIYKEREITESITLKSNLSSRFKSLSETLGGVIDLERSTLRRRS